MHDPQPTAQSSYSEMLRTQVAPRMRALGFKGSGGRYVLPDADRWLIVAFQKNRYSTAESVSFTVNLTAANKEAWEKFRGGWGLAEQPSGNAVYPGVEVIRLGPIAKTIG